MVPIIATTGNGVNFQIDSEDSDLLQRSWTATRHRKYLYITTRKRRGRGSATIGIHRLIVERIYVGQDTILLDPRYVCDHINGDTLDNRRQNLRLVTKSQNQHNAGINAKNTSGYRGVSWNKGRREYSAIVQAFGKNHFVGWFKDAKEAAIARDKKAKQLLGSCAWLNFQE